MKYATGETEEDLKGEEKDEAKENNEAARMWISGLEAVKRKLGLALVYDLSATPFFLRGSGYIDGRSVPFVDLDPSEGTLGLLVDDLAEAFGVTAAFMSVRLAKGGFIGRRFETRSAI